MVSEERWLIHSWKMGYCVGHAAQSFHMLHSVNEKRWGQFFTLLHTMWTSTTIGNQQSLLWCRLHRWAVLYSCQEGSRTLGFLNHNLKNCPQKLEELAYTSMCKSVLEYASPVWDPYLQRDIENLECIQQKGARFMLRTFLQRSSITSMLTIPEMGISGREKN